MSRTLLLSGLAFVFSACTSASTPPTTPDPASPAPSPSNTPSGPSAAHAPAPTAVEVTLDAKSGSTLAGKATLVEVAGGVKVTLSVSGVSPGLHGAHVHENGDCSAADGKSAGGHFNPGGHAHGMPSAGERHLGDLGNIEVDAGGEGRLEITAHGTNLKPKDPSSFLGRAIIVHEKQDDGGQPVGNAGGRIGCGVIAR